MAALYIYKIVPSSAAPPTPLPEVLPVSSLDQGDGFVHLSTALQVLGTLKHFFKEDSEVYLLRIPYERVEKDIKWESPDGRVCGPREGEGLFPHLYNGLKLGKEEVDAVGNWKRGEGWEKGGGELVGWDKIVHLQ